MVNMDFMNSLYWSERYKHISSEEKAQQIEESAEEEQIVVPFKPPHSLESRVKIITTDFFDANDLFGNNRGEYKNAEFLAIQMKRIGLDLQHFVDGEWSNIDTLKQSFQEPVLSVYGMMESGIMVTANKGTTETHIYTRNLELVRQNCGNYYADAMRGILLDQYGTAQKNHINCYELIPDNNKLWSCEPTVYVHTTDRTVTYALSLSAVRRQILSKLFDGVLEVEYYDFATQTIRHIVTTLKESVLSNIAEESVRANILDNLYDEKHMMSLNLPVLCGESKGIETAEVFLPAILNYNFHENHFGWNSGYDPFEGWALNE